MPEFYLPSETHRKITWIYLSKADGAVIMLAGKVHQLDYDKESPFWNINYGMV
jgi:hypothetical protein